MLFSELGLFSRFWICSDLDDFRLFVLGSGLCMIVEILVLVFWYLIFGVCFNGVWFGLVLSFDVALQCFGV